MPRDSLSPNLTPAQAAAMYQRGLAAFETERYADAIESLSAIGEVSSLTGTLARFYLGQAHTHCGVTELKAGRHAVAARHFNTARTINPDSANLSRYLAACHAGAGRFDLAAAEIERTPQTDPDDKTQPIRLAHALACDGRLPRAIETLVEVIDAEPTRVDVRLQLGLIYAAAEEFEDAICVLQEAAELAPLLPDVRQHLGLALAAVGDHSEATEHLAVAQKLRPHDAYLGLLLTLAVDAARSTCLKLAIDPATGRLDAVDDRSLEVLGSSEPSNTDPSSRICITTARASTNDSVGRSRQSAKPARRFVSTRDTSRRSSNSDASMPRRTTPSRPSNDSPRPSNAAATIPTCTA